MKREIHIELDIKTNSININTANRKFAKLDKFTVSEVEKSSNRSYIMYTTYIMREDEIAELGLNDDNVDDFNFYSYFDKFIKKGFEIWHLEIAKYNFNSIRYYED